MSNLKDLIGKFNKASNSQIATVGVHFDDPTRLASNIFAFDLATGGGVPEGRVSVIYGPESSLKTTICLKLIAEAQRKYPKKYCVFVDIEGHFSKEWATLMGVDIEYLVYICPTSGENAVDMVESIVMAEDVSVVCMDSLAALVSTRELGSEAEKAQVGTTGLLINKLYRKTSQALADAKVQGRTPTILMINQIRFAVGGYGDPEVMPGGPSFKFASSMTIRVRGKDEMDAKVSDKKPAFKKVSVIIKKCKVPYMARNSEFYMSILDNKKDNLAIGETYDTKTIMAYLKAYGLILKHDKKGWDLFDGSTGEFMEHYDTQDQLKIKLQDKESNGDFIRTVKAGIISVGMAEGGVSG